MLARSVANLRSLIRSLTLLLNFPSVLNHCGQIDKMTTKFAGSILIVQSQPASKNQFIPCANFVYYSVVFTDKLVLHQSLVYCLLIILRHHLGRMNMDLARGVPVHRLPRSFVQSHRSLTRLLGRLLTCFRAFACSLKGNGFMTMN